MPGAVGGGRDSSRQVLGSGEDRRRGDDRGRVTSLGQDDESAWPRRRTVAFTAPNQVIYAHVSRRETARRVVLRTKAAKSWQNVALLVFKQLIDFY